MRYDLKTPCKNCPFRSDETRIKFACRERAEEIEEQAYRHGFPCHLSAILIEDDDTFDGGFVAGPNTQHCIGYILMKIHEGCDSEWPGIDNDDTLIDRLYDRLDHNAPVFETTEEFFEANS